MRNSNLKEKIYDFLGTGPTKKCPVQEVKKTYLFVIYDATLLTVVSSTCRTLLQKY